LVVISGWILNVMVATGLQVVIVVAVSVAALIVANVIERVGLPIPQLLTGHDRGEKRSVGCFGFDAHELFAIDGDAVKHLPNQFFPLLVGHPRVRPQDRQVFKKFRRPFQVRQFGRLGRYGHQL